MTTLFVILIVLAAVGLGFIVLIQNPKGGGLNSSVAGVSNQLMGVKQTTDVLEKGTWIFAGSIAVLAIVSTMFLSGHKASNKDADDTFKNINPQTTAPATQPAAPQNTVPATQPAKPQ